MIPWPFLAFATVFGAILYLHFVFAHKEWKRSRGEQASDIDPDYIKTEDFFGRSFRTKVKEWLQLPSSVEPGTDGRTIDKGQERIRVLPRFESGSDAASDDVLVIEENFSCGPNCTFSREIYVRRDCRVGERSRLQAVAADGDLELGNASLVARWADSAGELEVHPGGVVRGRAFSRKAIRLGLGARVGSAYAPEISTPEREDQPLPGDAGVFDALEIPLPAEPTGSRSPAPVGFDSSKLIPLSSDCWLYNGHLRICLPLKLKTKLVVKGDCSCQGGSVLERDLKAGGSLRLGEGSVCHGNLIAGGSIYLGQRSRFHGVIHAGKKLRLCRGVRGEREDGLVAVYAAESLEVESNVVVKGKLASGEHVVAVLPPDLSRVNGTLRV